MKGKFKNKLLILLVALTSLFAFGGCTLSENLEEALANRELVAQVTYYSNGGMFGNSLTAKELYYRENDKAYEIGVADTLSGGLQITRTGYDFAGWYHVLTDAEGNPLYEDKAAGIYQLGEKVDFAKELQKDDHWIVAAKWRLVVGVKVVMVCDEDAEIEVGTALAGITEGKTSFRKGDEIGELAYNSQDKVNPEISEPDTKIFTVKDKAYTFLRYYEDEACTKPLVGELKRGETDITIYAKYVKGDWTRVSTKRDVSDMFKGLATGKNYWVMEDIDCGNMVIQPLTKVSGKLSGEGHTISNIKLTKQLAPSELKVAMFGEIESTAAIENITFENVTMTYTSSTKNPPEVYGVFTSLDPAATITNVSIVGKPLEGKEVGNLSFKGSGSSTAANFTGEYTNCLFGGFAKDSDYTGGFTVSLVVDGHAVGNAENE